MRQLTLDNITAAVESSFGGQPDARQRQVMNALVHHLHSFAKEVALTHQEWRAALAFLHRVGEVSSSERSEFSLLSDVLGLSSLVDLLGSDPRATPGSVLGPFHSADSPWRDQPVSLIADNPGERVLLRGRVLDLGGEPLPDATVDFWQNAANGLYWQIDPSQPRDNLRCRLKVDGAGRFEIATIRPVPYQIPTDGPVWHELVEPAGRSAWRPAHFHLIVAASGHRTLVTELFDAEDPWLDRDAVFGVREALIGRYVAEGDPEAVRVLGIDGPKVPVMRVELRLAPQSST